jgi:hypothetical protein
MICSTKNQASNCGYIAERASVGFSTLSGGIICKGGYYVIDRDLPEGLFWKDNKQNVNYGLEMGIVKQPWDNEPADQE